MDDNGLPPTERSLGQIVSYISLILNVSNIVASTILTSDYGLRDRYDLDEGVRAPELGPNLLHWTLTTIMIGINRRSAQEAD